MESIPDAAQMIKNLRLGVDLEKKQMLLFW